MENGDTKNGQDEIGEKSSDGTADIQANAHTQASTKAKKQPAKGKGKKWTLRQHWQHASMPKRLKWLVEGIGVIVGLLILTNYIWGNLQTMWNFRAEHSPSVVFTRPPELQGTISCQITDKAIYFYAGPMRVFVKNIGNSDATNAFLAPSLRLIPEKKTGVAIVDEAPTITDETCQQRISPKARMFPVYKGEDVSIDIGVATGVQSLIKTNSVSVTIGGPQKDLETAAGQSPDKISIANDATFRLYAPLCIYYFDENGEQHATCQNYPDNREYQRIQPGKPYFLL